MQILKGQRLALTQLFATLPEAHEFQISIQVSGLNEPIDFACFGLDVEQKLSNDLYLTFYNQPQTPCGAVKLVGSTSNSADFLCRLKLLPETIDRLVFTAALEGTGSMRQILNGSLRFLYAGREIASFAFTGTDFQDECAIMLGELYRKQNDWRFGAIGQGFNGGLSALVKHFGGEVAEEPVAQAPVSPKISLEKKIAEVAPALLNLAKKAALSLEKQNLTRLVARVSLVLDASGSMQNQYAKGKVQAVVERLLPLAVHFDDDDALDVWAFSTKVLALPPAKLTNYLDYIAKAGGGWRNWGMLSINNEPAVITEVIRHYQAGQLPVLVIFISDGGVSQNKEIKRLLVDAAKLPIFWQFVGIGGRNYGILEKLDTMDGRAVDNCGFFALDDLDSVSEQALYDRLLSEFPSWLKAAKLKGILR